MKKLAIISTHPIQYNAPWFQLLAEQSKIDLKVYYTWSQARDKVKDRTFGQDIKWDIPLLENYAYEFVDNIAKKPGSHHFFGIDNPQLIPAIKDFSPDAILVFGWSFKSHLGVLRHFKGKIPIWFRGDSTLLDGNPGIKTLIRRKVLRWVYRHIDKAFYVGSANKAYFLKHGLTEHQLVYAPHAVDNRRFMGSAEQDYEVKAVRWREELGLSSQNLVVLFAGKFEPKKQPSLLIKALIAANKERESPLKLVMVGQGPQEFELKALAKNHDCITFIPFINQSEMPVVYRLGDVFCLPSQGPSETWGLAVNEAMACGRAVIVSNKVGCAADLVQDGNGWVFEYNDLNDLKTILININQKTLRQMGQSAQRYINDWQFENIVKSLVNNL